MRGIYPWFRRFLSCFQHSATLLQASATSERRTQFTAESVCGGLYIIVGLIVYLCFAGRDVFVLESVVDIVLSTQKDVFTVSARSAASSLCISSVRETVRRACIFYTQCSLFLTAWESECYCLVV